MLSQLEGQYGELVSASKMIKDREAAKESREGAALKTARQQLGLALQSAETEQVTSRLLTIFLAGLRRARPWPCPLADDPSRWVAQGLRLAAESTAERALSAVRLSSHDPGALAY